MERVLSQTSYSWILSLKDLSALISPYYFRRSLDPFSLSMCIQAPLKQNKNNIYFDDIPDDKVEVVFVSIPTSGLTVTRLLATVGEKLFLNPISLRLLTFTYYMHKDVSKTVMYHLQLVPCDIQLINTIS